MNKEFKEVLAEAIEGCIDFEYSFCHSMCNLQPGEQCTCKEVCEKLNNREQSWYKESVEINSSAPTSSTTEEPIQMNDETNTPNNEQSTASKAKEAAGKAKESVKGFWAATKEGYMKYRGTINMAVGIAIGVASTVAYDQRKQAAPAATEGSES